MPPAVTYIIVQTLCIFAYGVPSYTVFFTTEASTRPPYATCTPVPTYRISNSSATIIGETLYKVAP